MTVQELMDQLGKLPADHMVLVEGYENGWDALLSVQVGLVKVQVPCEDWDGEFERHEAAGPATASAVLLVGRRGDRRTTG